jgi:molybdopterin/thiamine biosynthesis adenylyltransferase
MELIHENRAAIALAELHNIDLLEANNMINNSEVWLIAGNSIILSLTEQIAFITAVNIAKRVFRGRVICILPEEVPNLLMLKSVSFKDLVFRYGGSLTTDTPDKNEVKILFGVECYDENCLEVVAEGWRGGVNFYGQERVIFAKKDNPVSLGPIAAASLACYFAFSKIFKLTASDLLINTGISLWNINSGREWYKDSKDGPRNINIPRKIWALGLGHLGQAYLWTVGLMPISDPSKVLFLLQDDDTVENLNIGSQVLCNDSNIGFPKTRACLKFLEELNFKTQIVEKRFLPGNSEEEWLKEFPFLLNGVDNPQTRRDINRNYHKLFLDGATNGSSSLFDSFTLKNVSHIEKGPDILWPATETDEVVLHKNLYERYEKANMCGILTNIGVSVPFVGLFGATFVIAELLRSLNEGTIYSIVSTRMSDLSTIDAVDGGVYDKELMRFAHPAGTGAIL